MDNLIIAIVLICISFVLPCACLLIVLLWRRKKYIRQVSWSSAFFGLNILSFVLAFLNVVLVLFFAKQIKSDSSWIVWNDYLGIGLLFHIFAFIIDIHKGCYCLFLDGKIVVERTLFRETRINLAKSGTHIEKIPLQITIYDDESNIINFDYRGASGDYETFINKCQDFVNENFTENVVDK